MAFVSHFSSLRLDRPTQYLPSSLCSISQRSSTLRRSRGGTTTTTRSNVTPTTTIRRPPPLCSSVQEVSRDNDDVKTEPVNTSSTLIVGDTDNVLAQSLLVELSPSSSSASQFDTADRSATFEALAKLSPSLVIACLPAVPDEFLPRAKNVIDACAKVDTVNRFILLTSLGAGNSELSVPVQVQQALRPLLLDMTDAEAYLKAHVTLDDMIWTIVRPAPVDDDDDGSERPVSDLAVTEHVKCYGTVTPSQVARAVNNIAQSKRADGKVLHVVDRRRVLITSPYVRPLEKWESLPFDEYELE